MEIVGFLRGRGFYLGGGFDKERKKKRRKRKMVGESGELGCYHESIFSF